MKAYLGWGAFAQKCEHLVPDIEYAIQQILGKPFSFSLDLSDIKYLGRINDEYLYALKRLAAHIHFDGKAPSTSFIEDLENPEEDQKLAKYIDSYKKGTPFGSLIFFSETLGIYLPIKELKEPLHFQHEDKNIEICSVGSLYQLREELQKLEEKFKPPYQGSFNEEIPFSVEIETLKTLSGWVSKALEEEKPLVLVGEDY